MPIVKAPTVADADLRQMSVILFPQIVTPAESPPIRVRRALSSHPLQHLSKHVPQMVVSRILIDAQLESVVWWQKFELSWVKES